MDERDEELMEEDYEDEYEDEEYSDEYIDEEEAAMFAEPKDPPQVATDESTDDRLRRSPDRAAKRKARDAAGRSSVNDWADDDPIDQERSDPSPGRKKVRIVEPQPDSERKPAARPSIRHRDRSRSLAAAIFEESGQFGFGRDAQPRGGSRGSST